MRLEEYVKSFNENDREYIKNDIENKDCLEWLKNEIPLLECSDPIIEKTYYFRWWVYRKHIKNTPEGYVVTEFLPEVPWSGKYNVINAPIGHHIMEGRWLKNAASYLNQYIDMIFKYPEEGLRYSTWMIWAAEKLNDLKICIEPADFLKKSISYYKRWEELHKTDTELFWSLDDRDAMEFSISGSPYGGAIPGLRPTLNSYMFGDASAIYRFSILAGTPMAEYLEKAEKIRQAMKKTLWRDNFFKAIHPGDGDFKSLNKIDTSSIPRELIGYIPWYFSIPNSGDEVFELLESKTVFAAKEGMTTVEQSAEGFMYDYKHECLWNGYVWPFATSQVLTALINVIFNSEEKRDKYSDMFFRLLGQYANQHTRITESGEEIMWIDEVMSPYEKLWTSREKLKGWGWPIEKGGVERGKDYNHSTFCDIVISALSGIQVNNGDVIFKPIIPKTWEYFSLDNLYVQGNRYRIEYDKLGNRYAKAGLTIYKNGKIIN